MSDINEMNEGLRWYVAHTYSGYENKVKMNLEKIVENRKLGHLISEIYIPTETIIEADGGKEKEIESKIFPAYVLIKMVMTDESWHVVRNIRGVTGFVGPGSKPVPLSDEEVAALISEEGQVTEVSLIELGDTVTIIDGPFEGFSGKLTEIHSDVDEVTVTVSTVGKDMPIRLEKKLVRKAAEN